MPWATFNLPKIMPIIISSKIKDLSGLANCRNKWFICDCFLDCHMNWHPTRLHLPEASSQPTMISNGLVRSSFALIGALEHVRRRQAQNCWADPSDEATQPPVPLPAYNMKVCRRYSWHVHGCARDDSETWWANILDGTISSISRLIPFGTAMLLSSFLYKLNSFLCVRLLSVSVAEQTPIHTRWADLLHLQDFFAGSTTSTW
jgi:hypothetical protein